MADKKEEKKEAATPGESKKGNVSPKRGGTIGFFFFMIVFGASVPFILPTLTLVLIGMTPTIVALVTDNDRHKSAATSVGAMNAAGITPFIIDLWTKGQTMGNVFQIFRDPTNWLIMLGAAGIGQLIVFAVPQAVALLTFARAEMRLKILQRNIESLKDSWGPDVGTTKPIDKIEGSS